LDFTSWSGTPASSKISEDSYGSTGTKFILQKVISHFAVWFFTVTST